MSRLKISEVQSHTLASYLDLGIIFFFRIKEFIKRSKRSTETKLYFLHLVLF